MTEFPLVIHFLRCKEKIISLKRLFDMEQSEIKSIAQTRI